MGQESGSENLYTAMPLADLYKLWDRFSDIPVDDNDCLGEPFLEFDVGTHREDLWLWFESQNPDFVVGKVMEGQRLLPGSDTPDTPDAPPAAKMADGLADVELAAMHFGGCKVDA